MSRSEYAEIIELKLKASISSLRDEFHQHTVQSCFIDDLLPEKEANRIFEAFPDKETMMLKKSLRENKYVAAQMDRYTPILEEIIYAFQDPRVLKAVEEITGIHETCPQSSVLRDTRLEP
jgi:Rps23 Pro-64 3,4-dihydroxylase Tpa1-like proline 4-hydroxylase